MRDVVGQNDVASIHEVISRRFRRLQSENEGTAGVTDEAAEVTASGPRDENGRPRRFAYPPQLVVVDGGPAQVNAAQRALDELGIVDVAVVGLAKRLEEVWQPGDENPVVLPRTSEALYLLQRLRDEAHRFAIGFHRQRRSKSMTTSALDAVPGLGEVRRKALMKQFGSLKRLRAASEAEVATVPGIGPVLAAQVVAALAAQDAAPAAVNTATGELLE
jgi:excinuclease ABC subunit C